MMYRQLICFSVILLCVLGISAQEIRDSIELPPVRVEARKTAVPASFRSIAFDSAAMSMNSQFALSDMLRSSTPVYVKEYGLGGLASLALRGTAAKHTQVYWNGIALNSPMLGQVDFSLFPVTFLNQVELHPGAGSIIDGSGGLGGSLQLVNLPQWKDQWQLEFLGQAASFDSYSQQARIKWGDKRWQFHTSLYHKTAENDFIYRDYHLDNKKLRRKNAELSQKGGMQEIYYRVNNHNTLAVRTWLFESDRNLPTILGTESNAEQQYDRSIRTMAEWENRGKRHLFELKTAYLTDDLDYANDSLSLSSQSHLESMQVYSRYVNYISSRLEVLTQLQLREDIANSSGYADNRLQQSLSHLAGFTWNDKLRRLSMDLYSRQELLNYRDFYWIPALGVNYRIIPEKSWLLKASASRNIRYPTLNDLYWDRQGNEDLKVEKSRSVEAGIKNKHIHLSKKAELGVEGAVFHSVVNNWIIWQPLGNVWRPDNLKKVENKGVEATVEWKATYGKSTISAGLGYSYTASRNLLNAGNAENTVGKQLIYVPYQKLNSVLSWSFRGWFARYQQHYTDRVYIDQQNKIYLPAFMPADMAIGKKLRMRESRLDIQFVVHNLYDNEYQVIAERPMPGRYFSASIRYVISKNKE